MSPRTLLVPRAVTPFSNRDVLSGHVYQRKQLSKIKFAPAAPPKQMHIVLQNLDLFKNWILKPRCYTDFCRGVNTLSFTCCNEQEAFKNVNQRKQLLKKNCVGYAIETNVHCYIAFLKMLTHSSLLAAMNEKYSAIIIHCLVTYMKERSFGKFKLGKDSTVIVDYVVIIELSP